MRKTLVYADMHSVYFILLYNYKTRNCRAEERRIRSPVNNSSNLSAAPTLSCFKVVMVEMVNMEEMDVMECLVLKDHKDLQVNLVQQVDLQDLKASQE